MFLWLNFFIAFSVFEHTFQIHKQFNNLKEKERKEN